MITLRLIVLILALCCFGAAAVDIKTARVNLIALGLFLVTLAGLVWK